MFVCLFVRWLACLVNEFVVPVRRRVDGHFLRYAAPKVLGAARRGVPVWNGYLFGRGCGRQGFDLDQVAWFESRWPLER